VTIKHAWEMYDNLSDFISKSKVAIANGKAVIVVEKLPNQPCVTLIGFQSDVNKSDFEILEAGYEYFLKLTEYLELNG
jgi:hypothetical protein